MAQTPESRAIALLEAEAAIHRRYQEDVAASERLHAARMERHAHDRDADLANLSTVALELLKHALKLDEREPEPEKPRRTRAPKSLTLLGAEAVSEILALSAPTFAERLRDLHPNALKQLRISAEARQLVAHLATLDREIGGRS
jgi:hypothetical protein